MLSLHKVLYAFIVKSRAQSIGKNLHVNHFSMVSTNTVLSDNVNFNGMKISGRGLVSIGNNFHSGQKCLMISQIHNYEDGEAIPAYAIAGGHPARVIQI